MRKIAVIGNGGGGKTTLSRRLGQIHKLPVTHVDSIQFVPGMQIRALEETRAILGEIADRAEWLIDGYGPLDMIEERFRRADRIVFVDFPLWRHYWWCTKRQIRALWATREELPEGCNEATIAHTVKLFKTLWRVHTKMRPELLKIFARPEISPKMAYIRTLGEWRRAHSEGLS